MEWSCAGESDWLRFVTLDLDLILSRLCLGDIVGRLQSYPGFRRRAEGLGQPDRHVTGDPCTAIHQDRCPQRPRRPICYSRRMSVPSAVSPFVPGRGGLPPYLAGRDNEQHALKRLLAYLEHGRGAPRDVIVVGPRGNGKTVLLRWFQREIEAGETKIDAVWLTPSDIRSLDGLATELVPPRRFASLRPESLSFSVGIGRLGWELGDRPASLTRLLAARCRQRALVVLLDEAHDLGGATRTGRRFSQCRGRFPRKCDTKGSRQNKSSICRTAIPLGMRNCDRRWPVCFGEAPNGSSAEVRHRGSAARRIGGRRSAMSGGAGRRRLCLALAGSRQPLGARHPQPDELHRSHGTAWWSSLVIDAPAVEAKFSLPVPGGSSR